MQLKSTIVRGQFSSREPVDAAFMTILAQRKSPRSESGRLRRVDAKPIPPTLIPPRYLCRYMTQLLLNVALVDLGARSQPNPHAMPREQGKPIFLGQLAADTSVKYGLFDQSHHVFISKASIESALVVTGGAAEQRAKIDFGKVQPLFQRMNRAGLIARSAANLNLTPTGFAAQEQHRAVVLYLHLTAAVRGIVLAVVQADNLGLAQTARISDQQNRAIPQAAKIKGQGRDHGQNIVCEDGLFLHGRACFLLTPASTVAM